MSSKLTEKAFANAKLEMGNTSVANNISDAGGYAPSNWPPGLQTVISAIERIEDEVQSKGTMTEPVAKLMLMLKEVAGFAQSEISRVHKNEIEEGKATRLPIKWNADFEGHWENLLE
ncbi:hypothetical protein VKT23_000354 [Stygiomarasmius scandens]|uniref:Uncharacterized protein n=1 Tax=Marasmiellus scandens TaxID=2682957 RepID=A0ABR1K9A2_9AGAR